MKFNINKFGITWTTAFIMWNLAFILDGDGMVVHVACMIGQILLLCVFLCLTVVHMQQDIKIEGWRKEQEKFDKEMDEHKNLIRQVEEYKDGMA